VVVVQFTLDRQGRLRRARLDHSSGHRQLDEFALAQLQQMAPFPRSPAGETWSTRQFNIPMRYSPKRS
jgi:TonB family protein